MKIFLILATSLLLVTNVQAQEEKAKVLNVSERVDGTFNFYHSPVGFRVTIYSKEGMISQLDIPKGVHLNIQSTDKDNPDRGLLKEGFPKTFLGDVVIRTRRVDEVVDPFTQTAWEMMQEAPFQLSLSGVKVVVEKS